MLTSLKGGEKMKKIYFGLVILIALAVGFVSGQQSVETASGDVTVASASRGA